MIEKQNFDVKDMLLIETVGQNPGKSWSWAARKAGIPPATLSRHKTPALIEAAIARAIELFGQHVPSVMQVALDGALRGDKDDRRDFLAFIGKALVQRTEVTGDLKITPRDLAEGPCPSQEELVARCLEVLERQKGEGSRGE